MNSVSGVAYQHMRFVKMSAVDGSIILAKGSNPSVNAKELMSRRFDMQISLDGNY